MIKKKLKKMKGGVSWRLTAAATRLQGKEASGMKSNQVNAQQVEDILSSPSVAL